MKVADIRNNLADAINRVAYAGERIILERRGKGVAALVSVEDLELLQRIEDEADIKAARKALKEKGRHLLGGLQEKARVVSRNVPSHYQAVGREGIGQAVGKGL